MFSIDETKGRSIYLAYFICYGIMIDIIIIQLFKHMFKLATILTLILLTHQQPNIEYV